MMEIVAVVSVVVCAALLGVVGWLFLERGKLMAEAARSGAERQGIEDDLKRAEGRASEAEERAGELIVRASEFEVEAAKLREQVRGAGETLENERRGLREQNEVMKDALRKQLADSNATMSEKFRALASQVLTDARAELVKIGDEKLKSQTTIAAQDIDKKQQEIERMLQPIAETLKKTDEKLAAMEKERTSSYSELRTQVQQMAQGSEALRAETGKLSKALKDPGVRGRWGEKQLQRCVELAGMTEYCDFATQVTVRDADNQSLRPDLVIRLPAGRQVIVDAKTNIQSYMEAIETETEEQRETLLNRFAKNIADQSRALGAKQYQSSGDSAAFVVMFVPGDVFLIAALKQRPDLLDEAWQRGVLLATPSTLIGLLRAVSVGFNEEKLAKNALELREIGRELHKRAADAFEHVRKMGEALESATKHFNSFAGSYQERLLPKLRQIEDNGAKSAKELPQVEVVSTQLRLISEKQL